MAWLKFIQCFVANTVSDFNFWISLSLSEKTERKP